MSKKSVTPNAIGIEWFNQHRAKQMALRKKAETAVISVPQADGSVVRVKDIPQLVEIHKERNRLEDEWYERIKEILDRSENEDC